MSHATTLGMASFVAITGVRDQSILVSLGGVLVDTPSPLDVTADCRVGELADHRALALVGLAAQIDVRCHALSSGERWRLAIARAISTKRSPLVVDCRAPFAERADLVALALGVRHAGIALYVVTDDQRLAGYADLVVSATPSGLQAGGSGASTLDRTRMIHELLRGMT